MTFELQHTDCASDARAGVITTDHGKILTPIFMPVGTCGSVKGVHFSELRQQVKDECYAPAYAIAQAGDRDKHAREEAFTNIREEFKERYAAAHAELSPEELEEKNGLIGFSASLPNSSSTALRLCCS